MHCILWNERDWGAQRACWRERRETGSQWADHAGPAEAPFAAHRSTWASWHRVYGETIPEPRLRMSPCGHPHRLYITSAEAPREKRWHSSCPVLSGLKSIYIYTQRNGGEKLIAIPCARLSFLRKQKIQCKGMEPGNQEEGARFYRAAGGMSHRKRNRKEDGVPLTPLVSLKHVWQRWSIWLALQDSSRWGKNTSKPTSFLWECIRETAS